MDYVESKESKISPLRTSTSEGASLGNLLKNSVMTEVDAGAGKRLGSAGRGDLFTAPEPGSKRQRQSRYIVVDGHAVLRENNYSLEDGFISVFDGDEIRTGGQSAEEKGAGIPENFYINAAGKVVNADDARLKAERAQERQAKRSLEVKKDTRDPMVVAHRASLKEDSESSEIKRALFVNQHLKTFKLFVTTSFAKKAEVIAQHFQDLVSKANVSSSRSSSSTSNNSSSSGSSNSSAISESTSASSTEMVTTTNTSLTAEQKRELQSEDPEIKAAAQELRRTLDALRSEASTNKALKEIQQPMIQFNAKEKQAPGCIDRQVVQMRDYQITGVNFMLRMYHAGMSCVLADEMGLGKTLQTIAFLGTLKKDVKAKGAHLVVVPMSVLSNWMAEFKKFCPSLKVIRYHSSELSEKQRIRHLVCAGIPAGEVDVVVTTYEMVVSEGKNTGILSVRYRMLILDEAHKVKNDETQVSAACRRITREMCVFLTGTPVQNNLRECWALLNCMQPDVFSKSELFDDAFDPNDMTHTNLELVDSVHALMQLLVLRRKKAQVDLELPPKRELRLLCPLSKQQTFWYKRILLMNAQSLISSTYQQPTTTQEEGGDKNDESQLMNKAAAAQAAQGPNVNKLSNLMMQLRKVSNHPYLMTGAEREDKVSTALDLAAASGKLKMLDRLLLTLKREGHRCVIFSQFTKMLDLIEDFIAMRGYSYVRLDGSTNRIQRMINIGRFNAPQSTLFIFLLSTRAGGLGVNLQTADTCILYDSDWNPQCDLQAMARVHRIGQKRPVTIYRMVSAGTVEERIVARATRKLLLDEMVSKGSEDMLRDGKNSVTNKSSTASKDQEEDADEEVQASEMVRALKFTMKRMFKQSGGQTFGLLDDSEGDSMSNRNIDLAIERTRQVPMGSAYYTGTSSMAVSSGVSVGGAAGTGADISLDVSPIEEEEEENEEDDRMFSLTSDDIKTSEFGGEDFSFANLYKGKNLRDIRNEWEERKQVVEGKRDNKSRLVMVDGGVGVGQVSVLRENMYDLEDGEPSVFEREQYKNLPTTSRAKAVANNKADEQLAKANAPPPVATNPTRTNRAGMVYTNFKHCQACGHGGSEMIQCGNCPMSYHIQCIGFKNITEYRKSIKTGVLPEGTIGYFVGLTYFCSHHKCYGCKKNTAEAGNLLVRCIGCPLAFCEDCADWDGALNIVPEQPPHLLQKVGFWKCNQAVYCYCTALCQQVSDETDIAVLGKNHHAVKATELRKKQDMVLSGNAPPPPPPKKEAPIATSSSSIGSTSIPIDYLSMPTSGSQFGIDGFPPLTPKQIRIEYEAAANFAVKYGVVPTAYKKPQLVLWHRQQSILLAHAQHASMLAAPAAAVAAATASTDSAMATAIKEDIVASVPQDASTAGDFQSQDQSQGPSQSADLAPAASSMDVEKHVTNLGVGSGYDGHGGEGHGFVKP